MTKFYVKSGQIKKVIFAADSNAAALWLLNIVVDNFLPDEKRAEFESDPFKIFEDGLVLLGDQISVSSQAFEDEQADQFETMELFVEWNELAIAVSKMEKMLLGKQDLKLCELV